MKTRRFFVAVLVAITIVLALPVNALAFTDADYSAPVYSEPVYSEPVYSEGIVNGPVVAANSYQPVPVSAPAATVSNTSAATSNSANAAYLKSVKEISFSAGDKLSKKALELTKDKNTTEAKAMAIYSYIVKNFSYDWDLYNAVVSGRVKTYTPDANSVLANKKGICYDIASLYAAMCRSLGIPCKMVKGYSSAVNGYHAWNAVYDDAAGKWVSMDLTVDMCKGGKARTSWKSVSGTYTAKSAV